VSPVCVTSVRTRDLCQKSNAAWGRVAASLSRLSSFTLSGPDLPPRPLEATLPPHVATDPDVKGTKRFRR
jgi:hypothetical protein